MTRNHKCAVCYRADSGIILDRGEGGRTGYYCSAECLDYAFKLGKDPDNQPFEIAEAAAGRAFGIHMNTAGRTDMKVVKRWEVEGALADMIAAYATAIRTHFGLPPSTARPHQAERDALYAGLVRGCQTVLAPLNKPDIMTLTPPEYRKFIDHTLGGVLLELWRKQQEVPF
ncbi:MAG: hypothetical protein AB8B85_15220 [Paracoccaceae bacterium]